VTEDVPLRRERDLGTIVNDSLSLYVRHFGQFAAIVFPAVVASLVFALLILVTDTDALAFAIFIASIVVQFIVFRFVSSAGVVYLDRLDQRNAIPSAESLDLAQQRIADIGGAAIRSTLIIASPSSAFPGPSFVSSGGLS
jgi:predicted lysophospholipase L1 biosynthesis ABC-type transport system permease subunit